jgi:hypothetical protein
MDPGHLLRHLADRLEITEVVLRFARAMDVQDWALLRDCLLPELEVDYSDLRGDPPATVAAEEFVAARIKGLAGLKTQHISTNHLVTIDGDRAECASCFLIHRVDPAAPEGSNSFDTAGHYLHRLRRTAAGWRIHGIVQTVVWNRGRPEVHGALRREPPAAGGRARA